MGSCIKYVYIIFFIPDAEFFWKFSHFHPAWSCLDGQGPQKISNVENIFLEYENESNMIGSVAKRVVLSPPSSP